MGVQLLVQLLEVNLDTSLASRIKQVRGDLTQAQFAEKIGVHKNTLSHYERGRSNPDVVFIQALCTKYDINSEWLVFGAGPMKREENNKISSQSEYLEKDGRKLPDLVNSLIEQLQTERDESRRLSNENIRRLKENADLRVKLVELEIKLMVAEMGA